MFRPSSVKSSKNNLNRHTFAVLPQSKMENDEISLSIEDMHLRSPEPLTYAQSNNNLISNDYDDENFVTPSVRVRHSITYGYDEKKFQIFKGEVLFLIKKSNPDWWYCLRLDENQTFFVPASYLEELEIGDQMPNVVPPLRPPPPPPNLDRINQSNTKSNAAMTAAAVAAAAANSPASTFSTFTDYSQLTSKLKKPEVKARQLLNQQSSVVDSASIFNNTRDNKASRRSTYCVITNHPDDNDSSVNSNSTDNNVILRDKNVPGSMTDDSTDSIINEDYYPEIEEPLTYANVENIKEEDNHHYENIPVIRQKSITHVNSRKGIINVSDNELDNERSSQQSPDREQSEEEIPLKHGDEDDMEGIEIPEGWLKNSEKKFYYNRINDEKWFMTYDSNQRPYFYNSEGKSAWKLEELPLDEQSTTHFRKDFDDDLGTFNHLYNRYSTRKVTVDIKNLIPSTVQEKTPPKSLSSTSNSNRGFPMTSQSKTPSDGFWDNFRVVKVVEKGKKSKKRIVENYKIQLASTTLLFISNKNGIEKLDIPIDLKKEGGSCYKVDRSSNTTSNSNSASNKDNNNNSNKNEKIKLHLVHKFGRRDKEIEEILEDNIGINKCGFVIETLSGNKILVVHESEAVINEWITEINAIISQNPIATTPESIAQPVSDKRKSFKSSNSKKDEEHDSFEKTDTDDRLRKNSDPEKGILGMFKKTFNNKENRLSLKRKKIECEDLPPLPKRPPPLTPQTSVIYNKKSVIKSFLNSFLNRRPSFTTLLREGIIEECVYGANLINLCIRDGRMVPIFVTDIIKEIENKGLDMDGIYRISGNLAEVQKVRIQVDQGKHNFKDFDIHVLCGAFKTFFRELEEPLIPVNLHEKFLYYITISDQTKRFDRIQELITQMPIAHRETMRVVCEHLVKVVKQSSENRMTVQNVALVFGPNIIRSDPIINSNQGFNPHIMTQNVLVEYILKNFKELYRFKEMDKFFEEEY